jgi:predicted RNA-binding Zn ribbon-like protein
MLAADAMPLAALVDLVNGWGTLPRVAAGEQGLPYPPQAELVRQLTLPNAALRRVTTSRLTAVADAVFPVFAAESPADRARLVSGLLADSGVRPALRLADGRVEEAWETTVDHALPAAAAAALYEQLRGHDPGRLGTCRGDRCSDVYVDASPGAHRRFCSVKCQNRARVAAFRRRRNTARSVASATGEA